MPASPSKQQERLEDLIVEVAVKITEVVVKQESNKSETSDKKGQSHEG